VTRQLLGIVIAVALIGGAVMTLNHLRTQPEAPESTASVQAPARPAIREAPQPETPAPKPSVVRRPPAPTTARAPLPAPTPEAAPEVGTLRIDSDVPGAQVFIDQKYIGATLVTAADIKPGSHTLKLSAQGYDAFVETIDVSPGQRDILIKFREVRLDARIGVVHKHRFGSCKGELIATAQGLRYETSDAGDSFSESLLALDTFDVDYLKKNLKVKVRKGREYNFTDPDGNADRLFVFHRDVGKARDRLEKGDLPAGQ
jgi:hypothetical protein